MAVLSEGKEAERFLKAALIALDACWPVAMGYNAEIKDMLGPMDLQTATLDDVPQLSARLLRACNRMAMLE